MTTINRLLVELEILPTTKIDDRTLRVVKSKAVLGGGQSRTVTYEFGSRYRKWASVFQNGTGYKREAPLSRYSIGIYVYCFIVKKAL